MITKAILSNYAVTLFQHLGKPRILPKKIMGKPRILVKKILG